MARKAGRRRTSKEKQTKTDLEAIGLVLLAAGIFILGVLLPQLPTGDFGGDVRRYLTGVAGWGAYSLPWPLLGLGGLFLLRLNPRSWPRVLVGYVLAVVGLWLSAALLATDISGSWGRSIRVGLTGAAGGLALVPSIFLITLGVEAILGWRPTALTRLGAIWTVRGLSATFSAGARARRRMKDRAAFGADVALERGKLVELERDLTILSGLYPGSRELGRWRKEVQGSRERLAAATPEALEEVRFDVKAWQEAVDAFTRDRADELAHNVRAEGILGFEEWLRGVKAQLNDPVPGAAEVSRELDAVRKAMALDLTGVSERYRRVTRERDLTTAALREARPRDLERITREHGERLASLKSIESDGHDLSAGAEMLDGWRDLAGAIESLRAELEGFGEFEDFRSTLAGELRSKGRALLVQLEGWERALASVESRGRSWQQERRLEEEQAAAAALTTDAGAPEDAVAWEDDGGEANEGGLADDGEWDRGHGPGTWADDRGTDDPESDDPAEPDASTAPLRDAARGEAAGAGVTARAAADMPPWEVPEDYAAQREGEQESAGEELPEVGGIPIQLPGMDLLDGTPATNRDDPSSLATEVRERVRKIDATLANFKLEGRVVSSVRGPTVTRFEVEPAPGEKISRFANLSDDLALAMAVGSVRIEAPIPGKSVIGLEVPNANRDLIRFRQAVESPAFRRAKARLPLILGQSIDGEMVVGDLARMPHLLIAGSTGSGKSVAVNTLIGSLLYKFLPTELRFLMIDPKMVELTPFDGVPHLLRPVVTNPNDAAGVLLGAVSHMERRYKMMSRIGAKNLDQYNEKARNLDMPQLPFIVIIIDELADLMITSPKEVESAIMRLAQMARATGMHLVLATQRPSVDILTSLIKVNVPARVAFAVSSGHDSRTILDTMGAERLVGMGDMLFYQPGLVKPVRLQGPFISEAETGALSAFLRRQYFDDEFVEAYGDDFDPPSLHESEAEGYIDWNDDKLRAAAELVIQEGQASVSRLQRRLQIGHARAGKLMDSLEALGVVGAHSGSKPRDVLVDLAELPNIFGK